MTGTGKGREPMLFLVFLLRAVTLLFPKSISETLNDSISPRLKPVPKANRILIVNVLYGADAVSKFLI